tara:strand:+ start:1889 stop:2434 length:546 start_codon:yes stop_codon:yes gene_type:complete
MTNINRIIIVYINLNDGGYMPSLDLFDYYTFSDDYIFIGVTIDNKSFRMDIEDCRPFKILDTPEFSEMSLNNKTKNKILNFIGFNISVDEILDTMNNIDHDSPRLNYLETMIYYKTHQDGKNINEYNLKVKHFDDLINNFSQDFYSYKTLAINKDFSETEILLETYLTKEEINKKFKDYLL